MELVNWQSVLTEHQVHTLAALQRLPGVTLTVVVGREELPERKSQGWTKPDWGHLNVVLLDHASWFRAGTAVIRAHPSAVHLFNGLWADRRIFLLLLYALWRRRKIGLVTEPYSDTVDGYLSDQHKAKGWVLSQVRSFIYGAAGKLLGKKIGPVFAISPKAVRQFEKVGFPARNIYPFGYFVPAHPYGAADRNMGLDGELRLVFVGALIARKGVDVLFQMASFCREKNIPIRLDIYGPGESDLPFPELPNMHYCGVIPFGQAQEVIARYDVLIVPSRYDGWGVVVNEALQQGVPVLASSNAGASALVSQSGAGAVFDPGNMPGLVELIESLANDRTIIVGWKKKAWAYAGKLAPEIAASYMLECIEANLSGTGKPPCPWYSMDEDATFN